MSPSTRCGVTGLRPTYGIVSKTGIMSLSWTMDKVGPICRSSKDCAIVLNKIKGKDEGDPFVESSALIFDDQTLNLNEYKIGYLKSLFALSMELLEKLNKDTILKEANVQ